jgi:hypothetical protein
MRQEIPRSAAARREISRHNESILQPFCLENEKVRWRAEVTGVPQFPF